MRFQNPLLALVAAIGLTSTVNAALIPDGEYIGENLQDGYTLWTSVSDPTLTPIKLKPQEKRDTLTTRSAKFTKRRTDCWGNGLDHAGTDNARISLRGWANTGTTLTSGNGPTRKGFVSNDVLAYYCITRAHTSGNLDINDVNKAIGEMDAKCAAYTASWFGWDGSSELVGKAHTGQQICTGPFN